MHQRRREGCFAAPGRPLLLAPHQWRRASASGSLAGLTGTLRSTKRTPDQVELDKLRRRNERLERELAKTEAALMIMGKAHELLELLSESSAADRPSSR